MIRIIPVLDLMGGVVVRGIAGRRSEYRPIKSRLVDSSQPIDIARAFREQFGLDVLYVADLDAIAGKSLDADTLRLLVDDGFSIWLDGGFRTVRQAYRARELGIARIVAGLETLAAASVLSRMQAEIREDQILFSLDMKEGRALSPPGWGTDEPLKILDAALAAGVTRVLFLDLAQVGVGAGVKMDRLVRAAHMRRSVRELVVGGGVRDLADIEALEEMRVDAVLVASALHDGRIPPTTRSGKP